MFQWPPLPFAGVLQHLYHFCIERVDGGQPEAGPVPQLKLASCPL